jgi:hypothetical protein
MAASSIEKKNFSGSHRKREAHMSEDDRGDERETQAIEIKLYPLQLMVASLEGYALQIRGAAYEKLPRGYIECPGLTSKVELRALDYWPRFGETVLFSRIYFQDRPQRSISLDYRCAETKNGATPHRGAKT